MYPNYLYSALSTPVDRTVVLALRGVRAFSCRLKSTQLSTIASIALLSQTPSIAVNYLLGGAIAKDAY